MDGVSASTLKKKGKIMVDPNHQPLGVRSLRITSKSDSDNIIFIAINSESMGRYTGGIDEPTDKNCSSNNLNHAVEIVGYNVYESENGKRLPYWIIKNSWGTEWGDNGYYYLVRGRNACGIASDVSFPFVG